MSPWTSHSFLREGMEQAPGSVLYESEAESVSWVVNQPFKVLVLIVYLGFVKQNGAKLQVHNEQIIK